MRKLMIGMVAFGTIMTAAAPAAAQTRPHVSGSESSRSTEPTCVVNGSASNCDGGAAMGTMTLLPAPVIVGMPPILGPAMGPVMGPIMGTSSGERASTDTDVNRTSHHGSAITR